jgi:hypothetical protein
MREHLEEKKSVVDNMANNGSIYVPFDYSYISFNSLYRNRATTQQNKLLFTVQPQADSTTGISGVTKAPTQIAQIQISPILLSRKFILPVTVIDDLYYGKLYVLISEFSSQAYVSHNGFRYHFVFLVDQDPNDVT